MLKIIYNDGSELVVSEMKFVGNHIEADDIYIIPTCDIKQVVEVNE